MLLLLTLLFTACKDDEDKISKLEDEIEALEDFLDSANLAYYKDSLAFVIQLSEIEYQRYTDSLRRADSIVVANTNGDFSTDLPFTYTIVVFDGSNTAINGRTEAAAAFDGEVTVSITQFGETISKTTTDGLVSFENIGRGIISGSIKATGYTTFQWSSETLIRPTLELIDNAVYMEYVINSALGHAFTIFSTSGDKTSTLSGQVTAQTDLTNTVAELAPVGTTISAFIDVDDASFTERFVTAQNIQLFTDNILTYGYSPVLTAATDASGIYTFAMPASPMGLPIKMNYSDFVADQTAFIQSNGDVTERVGSAVYGQSHTPTAVPTISVAPTVSFSAGGGASITAQVSGSGSITALNLVNGGQNFQGTPRIIIGAPNTAGGTQATATATVANGIVTGVTLTDGGSGYTSTPSITITEGFGATAQVTSLYPNDFDTNASGNQGGGVAAVQIGNSGGYWSNNAPVTPFVLFNNVLEGSAASVPDVSVSMNAQGNIASISVNNRGYGYASVPAITITSGRNATAVVDSVNGTGAIARVVLSNAGEYYAAVADITVAGGGSGATFTVDIDAANNSRLTNLQITSGGTGYTVGQTISFDNGTFSNASASAVWEGQSIETYQITSSYGGTAAAEYINTPLIVFSEPDYKGANSRTAEGTAVIVDGRLTGINFTDHGRGYYTAPSITILSGSGASAQTAFDEMKISGFSISNSGSGYLAAPDLIIVDSDGFGTGATATTSLTDGRVTGIQLTNPGSGYINSGSITVVVLDPGTTYNEVTMARSSNPATASVEVTDGVITAVNIIESGDNYKAANVMISSIMGTGFTATAAIANGQIANVTVTSGGTGYVNNNVPGVAQPFTGPATYTSTSGITRIVDIYYGTGKVR